MFTDKNIAYKRKKLWIPATQFNNGGPGSLTPVDLGALALYGLAMTTGTPVEGKIKLPADMNPDFPLGFNIHWAATWGTSDTTADTTSWILLANFITAPAGVVLAAATGALDTIIPLLTANAQALTNQLAALAGRGIKNAGWRTKAQIHAGSWMQFSIEADATTINTGASGVNQLLGLEVDYVPMHTIYPHNEQDCPLDDTVS